MPEPKFEVYKDETKNFRWRLIAPNNQVIAVSGEGFKAKDGCMNGIASVKENAPKARIHDLTG